MTDGRLLPDAVSGMTRCYVIAEAGVNHDGKLERALTLVDVAVDAGADAVKFQVFNAELLASEDAPKALYQIETTGPTKSQLEMLRELELPFDAFEKLRAHCRSRDIEFLATPFDPESADFLESLQVRAFKIGSGDLTNVDLLAHVATKGLPVILSTGMSWMADVETAVRAIADAGDPELILLHCLSSYPADPRDVNLAAIETLRSAFGVPVGYSDHTLGTCVALAAVARGAAVLEKHFTLDPSLPGPDHRMSLGPEDLARLIREIRIVESAIGDGVKKPKESEEDVSRAARRSLTAAIDLAAGTTLIDEHLEVRRPGTGIAPTEAKFVVGRSLKKSLKKGDLIRFEDLQ